MLASGRRLSDEETAAILSYVRSSWGNEEENVAPEGVWEIRSQYVDRTRPWTAAQLRQEQ
jgi:mono/diheme cytochrome c family protein